MKIQLEKQYYTREEYLELEEQAEVRSEYRNGEILPMTGGTTDHNQIIINLIAHLKFGLKGQGYRLFTSDVRLYYLAFAKVDFEISFTDLYESVISVQDSLES